MYIFENVQLYMYIVRRSSFWCYVVFYHSISIRNLFISWDNTTSAFGIFLIYVNLKLRFRKLISQGQDPLIFVSSQHVISFSRIICHDYLRGYVWLWFSTISFLFCGPLRILFLRYFNSTPCECYVLQAYFPHYASAQFLPSCSGAFSFCSLYST